MRLCAPLPCSTQLGSSVSDVQGPIAEAESVPKAQQGVGRTLRPQWHQAHKCAGRIICTASTKHTSAWLLLHISMRMPVMTHSVTGSPHGTCIERGALKHQCVKRSPSRA